jgi:CRP-like cAMP-binding protein
MPLLTHSFFVCKGFDLESVASEFPLDMHEQIKMSILSGFVYNVDFFKGLAEDFIRGVVMGLRSNACLAQDYFYREGHFGLHMIFLRKGTCRLLVDVAGVTSLLDSVDEGGYFGEISWFLKTNRTETAMAGMNSEYYTLDYDTFEKACQFHPEYTEMIRLKVSGKLQTDIDDWEDATLGFSDIYSDEKREQLTEKLRIAKYMFYLCNKKQQVVFPPPPLPLTQPTFKVDATLAPPPPPVLCDSLVSNLVDTGDCLLIRDQRRLLSCLLSCVVLCSVI